MIHPLPSKNITDFRLDGEPNLGTWWTSFIVYFVGFVVVRHRAIILDRIWYDAHNVSYIPL